MVEQSLSLWKKSFGDIVSLLEKVRRTTSSIPQELYRNIRGRGVGWGGVGFKQTAEICTAHSRLHSFSYLCSTKPPLPKRFPLPPKPLWIKKNSGKCFGHQQLKRCSSSRRNRDLLDSKEALMHCTVLNMAHLHCPKCTKGSGPIGSATQKRQLGAAKWQHMQA